MRCEECGVAEEHGHLFGCPVAAARVGKLGTSPLGALAAEVAAQDRANRKRTAELVDAERRGTRWSTGIRQT